MLLISRPHGVGQREGPEVANYSGINVDNGQLFHKASLRVSTMHTLYHVDAITEVQQKMQGRLLNKICLNKI